MTFGLVLWVYLIGCNILIAIRRIAQTLLILFLFRRCHRRLLGRIDGASTPIWRWRSIGVGCTLGGGFFGMFATTHYHLYVARFNSSVWSATAVIHH
jgi:hypothetical protein